MSAPAQKLLRSEKLLARIASVSVRMEDKSVVKLDVADEVRIPKDMDDIRDAASESPARIAFWSYQAARAAAEHRRVKIMHLRVIGRAYLRYHKYIDVETSDMPTKNLVGAYVRNDAEVRASRIALSDAQRQSDVIRAVRDAVQHRGYVLQMLLKYDSEVARNG